ncbi:hypothetical protein [Alkaliphilus metalliredigens]|uniref:hypothetical protein n=1 Tax=Alkaliphilus metalliredigens TaxID=208226 RepID=UPI000307D24E|nr:hypothetical protein [Alkaliphilus metalliredigens]
MKKLKKIVSFLEDILFIVGITLFSIGVFKIYIPAGFIVLGICFIAGAYFIAKRR